jgi:hypothetical protein
MICAHLLGLSQSQLGMNREAHFSFMPFEQPNSSRFIRNVRLNDSQPTTIDGCFSNPLCIDSQYLNKIDSIIYNGYYN